MSVRISRSQKPCFQIASPQIAQLKHCLQYTLSSSYFLTGFSLCTCSYFAITHHFPFPRHSSTPKPINWWTTSPFCVGTFSVPFLSRPPHPLPPSLPHWPPDGRGTDPSLLVRSVTSVAHLGVARGASGRVRASPTCQGSWLCQLLHLQRAAAADATHLQVNVFWEELCQSAGEWSKPAIQLEQNRLQGFLHCKVRQSWQPLVGKKAVVSRVRLAYC